MHHLTRPLAAEWAGRGVRVNAVAPTYIETEMNKYVYEDEEMYRDGSGNLNSRDKWIFRATAA